MDLQVQDRQLRLTQATVRPHSVYSVAVERVAMTQYRYTSQVFVHYTDIWSWEDCYGIVKSSCFGFGEARSVSVSWEPVESPGATNVASPADA